MANLNFKIEGNSESFIKETEQIDSSIRTLATDIEKQEQKIGKSFKKMTASFATIGSIGGLGWSGIFRGVKTAASKAIPVLGTISTLADIYSLITSLTKAQREEQNKLNDSMDVFNRIVQNHAAQPIATIEQLSTEFQSLGDNMDAQRQFIVKNKKAFDELGVSIRNGYDAQQLLVDNKDTFIAAQIAKATSLAYQDKRKEVAARLVGASMAVARKEKDDAVDVEYKAPIGGEGYYIMKANESLKNFRNAMYVFSKEQVEASKKEMEELMLLSLQSEKEASDLIAGLGVAPKVPQPRTANARQMAVTHQKEQQTLISEKEETERQGKANIESEKQAMIEYLKIYGTYQQQKLAMAQDYAEKIRKATAEHGVESPEVKTLERQRQKSTAQHETAAMQANIDWVTVFSEFGGIASSYIQPELDKARAYTQTKEFTNTNVEAQTAFLSSIEKMESILGEPGGNSFKKLGQDVQIYQDSLRALNEAKAEEAVAIEKLVKAQEDYEQALKKGSQAEQDAAKETLNAAKRNADEASNHVQEQTSVVTQNNQSLSETATNLKKNMDNVVQGLSKLSSGSLSGAYSGIIQASNGMKDAIGKTSENLREVPIIGWILSIIDVLKDGLSNLVGGLLDAVFNAISGILDDVLSGDLFVTIGESLLSGISKIFDAISFGGFSSLMDSINGSNAKEVQQAIDKLTDRNEILGKSIDRLTTVMDDAAGGEVINAYKDAKAYQEEQNDNMRQIAKEQARYSSSHHSWNYYMEWTEEQLDWARKNVDGNFSGTESLWDLSPEDMNLLLSNVSIYEQIKSAGKGGYGERVMEKLEDFADQAGKLDELTDKIHTSLMQMSFDSLRDSFLNSLMDMDKDAKGFSEDFAGYMQRALLNFAIGDLLNDKLEGWYNGIAKDIQDQEGKLREEQIDQYRSDWEGYVQEGISIRDGIAEITGYGNAGESSGQQGTNGGFQTMSQDTGSELNGRFTALQISNEEIKNSMQFALGSLSVLCTATSDGNFILSDMRNLAVISNGHLEDIAKYTKVIQGFGEKLDNIDRNTKKL
ncbi:hypothetical protein LDZ77_21550 [Bacteroides xylanisolvens]|uniref:Phage tail tape measure protein n=1 Tax=Bacteroides xylanisolvens TaxID=371601 RepID=A0AAW4T718_9BACE|nr:hypothetical protein [Bacteroides xylanisolvens]MCA4534826.1 hypothetical protein [Bacteroides xylanisolvens]MCA4552878.1 hypothetical protein [Bacteroides xylanisolvens]MCA4566436.1 hypothetical protein [Bacteroides xylanisolvens]MCA4571368.1 hypothetical protein [Bacteroides xylanisolvens]MCA4601875.1 hypothetical protein [Bacteroides xylanisolvens]